MPFLKAIKTDDMYNSNGFLICVLALCNSGEFKVDFPDGCRQGQKVLYQSLPNRLEGISHLMLNLMVRLVLCEQNTSDGHLGDVNSTSEMFGALVHIVSLCKVSSHEGK